MTDDMAWAMEAERRLILFKKELDAQLKGCKNYTDIGIFVIAKLGVPMRLGLINFSVSFQYSLPLSTGGAITIDIGYVPFEIPEKIIFQAASDSVITAIAEKRAQVAVLQFERVLQYSHPEIYCKIQQSGL